MIVAYTCFRLLFMLDALDIDLPFATAAGLYVPPVGDSNRPLLGATGKLIIISGAMSTIWYSLQITDRKSVV